MPQYLRTDNQTKRIISIQFMNEPDDMTPDEKELGCYSRHPGPEDRTIDVAKRGPLRRDRFRYYIAAMSGEETGNPDSVEQDFQRCEAFNRGEWSYTWNYAQAKIVVRGVIQTITSGGLCGVESDSNPAYFNEIMEDEFAELGDILLQIGFTPDEVAIALKKAK